MMSNYRGKAPVRCFLLVLCVSIISLIAICGSLMHEKRSAADMQSAAISAAVQIPSENETKIVIERMHEEREKDLEKGMYGKLSLTELSYFPNISVGVDLEALRADLRNLDLLNEDEQKVIDATYISAYKQVLVIKLPMGYNGASFGAIFIGDKITSIQTVRHEYGHTRQLRDMGLYLYIVDVAIPSVMANLLDREGKLPYDYYGSYWEASADELGDVNRNTNNEKWPDGADSSIWKLCAMFD